MSTLSLQTLVLAWASTLVLCQLKWVRLHNGLHIPRPAPRRDMAMGYDTTRNQVVIFGGRPGPLHDTWIYSLSNGSWREVVTILHPPARHSSVSGLSGDYFYVTTGEGKDKQFYNDIWSLDLIKEEWKSLPAQNQPYYVSPSQWTTLSLSAFRPAVRYSAGGGIFPGGRRLFVSQGFSSDRHFDTLSYDVEVLGWQREYCSDCNPYDPRYPHARCHQASTLISDHELVVYGGCLTGGGSGGPCPASDSWVFDSTEKTWRQLESCTTPRMHARMAALPSSGGRRRVLLYGGIETTDQVLHVRRTDKDIVAVLDPDSGKWTQKQTTADDSVVSTPGWRASSGLVTGNDGILMFGGVDVLRNSLHNDLWLLRGDARDADTAPAVSCASNFLNMIMVHGILMVIGWAVFLQWGAYIARYMKYRGALWFYVHVSFQIFGLCCAIAGLVFGILSVQFDHFRFTHAIIGLIAIVLAALQPINALIRPPKIPIDSDVKSHQRRFWECVHHFGGRIAIFLAFFNISLGVFLAVSQQLIWALWFAYFGLVVGVYFLTEACRSLKGRKRFEPIAEGIDFHPADRNRYILSEPQKEPPADYISAENIGL